MAHIHSSPAVDHRSYSVSKPGNSRCNHDNLDVTITKIWKPLGVEVRISRILAPVAEHQAQPRPFEACCWPWSLLSLVARMSCTWHVCVGGVDVGFLIKGFRIWRQKISVWWSRRWSMRATWEAKSMRGIRTLRPDQPVIAA